MSETRIHPRALVEQGAELGSGVCVGPLAYVGRDVKLGDNCEIMAHAVVSGCCVIGADCVIHPHAVLGGPPQDLKYGGGETRLIIGERNCIREGATVNTGTERGGGVTVLGDDNFMMANSHVAHDCIVGDRVVLANNVMLAGHVRVQDGAILNGGAGVHHFTTIGRLAYVGGLSRITRDVPPYVIVEGHPSRVRGVNVIGLKRAGFDENVIRAIRSAHKLLFRSDRPMRDALANLRAEHADKPDVLELVSFLEASENGRQGRQGEDLGRGLA